MIWDHRIIIIFCTISLELCACASFSEPNGSQRQQLLSVYAIQRLATLTAMDIRWTKIARPKLMDLRDAFRADDSIIDLLFSKFLINEEDRQKLRQLTNQDRVSMLIAEILPSKGRQSFDRFLSALRDAEGFSHIVELLSPVPVRERRSSSSSSSGVPSYGSRPVSTIQVYSPEAKKETDRRSLRRVAASKLRQAKVAVSVHVSAEGGRVRFAESTDEAEAVPVVVVPQSSSGLTVNGQCFLSLPDAPAKEDASTSFYSPLSREDTKEATAKRIVVSPYVNIAVEGDERKVEVPIIVELPHADLNSLTSDCDEKAAKVEFKIIRQVKGVKGNVSDWSTVEDAEIGQTKSLISVSSSESQCFVLVAESESLVREWRCIRELEVCIYGDAILSEQSVFTVVFLSLGCSQQVLKKFLEKGGKPMEVWSLFETHKIALPRSDDADVEIDLRGSAWKCPSPKQKLNKSELLTMENLVSLIFSAETESSPSRIRGSCTVSMPECETSGSYSKILQFSSPSPPEMRKEAVSVQASGVADSSASICSPFETKPFPSQSLKMERRLMTKKIAVFAQTASFHPYDPHLLIGGINQTEANPESVIEVWNWKAEEKIGNYTLPSASGILTSVSAAFVTGKEETLVMVGTGNGMVSLWKKYLSEKIAEWDLFRNVSVNPMDKVHLEFQQHSGRLFACNESEQCIQYFDIRAETLIQTIRTEGQPMCMSSESEGQEPLLVVGDSDGIVQLYDYRISSDEKSLGVFPAHPGMKVSDVCLGMNKKFYSGSLEGKVKIWDIRNSSVEAEHVIPVVCDSSLAFHRRGSVVSCGTSLGDTCGRVYLHDIPGGDKLNTIRCAGNPLQMAFHPLTSLLAVTTTGLSRDESVLAIYSGESFDR